ncbi:hypothetical protein KBY70_13590 [Cyanobium sp. ATX 6E8]|nr:hypothetical protein [Cyanobium sp. ATX 6E8]
MAPRSLLLQPHHDALTSVALFAQQLVGSKESASPSGWVAQFTGDGIADRFPLLD